MVSLINSEDKKVADAVEKVCPQIAAAIDLIYARMKRGGRLHLTAAAVLPGGSAYSMPPNVRRRILSHRRLCRRSLPAGGARSSTPSRARRTAQSSAKEDMLKLALTENDTLVGIAASGRTPYVLGAMKAARGVALA